MPIATDGSGMSTTSPKTSFPVYFCVIVTLLINHSPKLLHSHMHARAHTCTHVHTHAHTQTHTEVYKICILHMWHSASNTKLAL